MVVSRRFSMSAALLFSALALVGCGGDGNPADGGKYTVTFSANGGSGAAPEAIIAANGSSITLPSGSGLSRSGYTFGGWNTNSAGTGTNYAAGSYYTPASNVTLYARWTSNTNATSTGTVRITNNSGSTISVQMTPTSGQSFSFSITNNVSSVRSGTPVGRYTVTATRSASPRNWSGSVTVSTNQTSSITIGTSGWRN